MSNSITQLRREILQKRSQIDKTHRDNNSLILGQYLKQWLEQHTCVKTIAAFWPIREEPDLRPFLKQCIDEAKHSICLPRMVQPNAPLVFYQWTQDTPLKIGHFGVSEPDGNIIIEQPDLILVPTVGFNRQGARMGYGKGYYDRTLDQLAKTGKAFQTIGIAWDEGLLPDHYEPAPHDYPLDAILTPSGWQYQHKA